MPIERPVPAPDVIVIGGGIVGVSAAAHLAAAGRRVLVLERTAIAAGASGRNSGVVQHPMDPVLVALHLETLELYRNLEAASDGGFRLPDAPAGLLLVTHDDDQARALAARMAIEHQELSPTHLSPREVRELEPQVGDGVSACRLQVGYPVGPARATTAYADLARATGVEVEIGQAARPVVRDGRVIGVTTADGMFRAAGAVLVAAGPWTPDVVDPAGRWRPIRATWGLVVVVRLERPPGHVLEEAEIDIEPGVDDAPAPTGPATDDGIDFSLITADGDSALGSTFLDDTPDADTLVPALVRRGAAFVPAIATARLGPTRACARPLSRDGRPLIGRVPWIDGLWVAAGHGPWGISTGPASGRLVADLMAGREPSPPPALDPSRFGGPR